MFDCLSYMNANGMGWMIWAGSLFRLAMLVLLGLGIAALVRYLGSDRQLRSQDFGRTQAPHASSSIT